MNTTHRTTALAAAALLGALSLSACGDRTEPDPAAPASNGQTTQQTDRNPDGYRADTCDPWMQEGSYRACVLRHARYTDQHAPGPDGGGGQ